MQLSDMLSVIKSMLNACLMLTRAKSCGIYFANANMAKDGLWLGACRDTQASSHDKEQTDSSDGLKFQSGDPFVQMAAETGDLVTLCKSSPSWEKIATDSGCEADELRNTPQSSVFCVPILGSSNTTSPKGEGVNEIAISTPAQRMLRAQSGARLSSLYDESKEGTGHGMCTHHTLASRGSPWKHRPLHSPFMPSKIRFRLQRSH